MAGASGHGRPTGTVTFTDTFGAIPGGNQFALNGGDQLNNGSNTATPNGISTFDAGTHTISASYSGDASFNGTAVAGSSSSPPITFTIQPGFFAAVNSRQVTITARGSSGSTAVSVSSSTGFSGTISLACSGLPAGATCVFSPSSIKATGTLSTTSSTITVTMTAAAAASMLGAPRHILPAHWVPELGLLVSVALIGGPRRRRTRVMSWWLMLLLVVVIPGCGGGSSNSTPPAPPPVVSTPTGSYNVVVTATSGSATSSTGFAVVQ